MPGKAAKITFMDPGLPSPACGVEQLHSAVSLGGKTACPGTSDGQRGFSIAGNFRDSAGIRLACPAMGMCSI